MSIVTSFIEYSPPEIMSHSRYKVVFDIQEDCRFYTIYMNSYKRTQSIILEIEDVED